VSAVLSPPTWVAELELAGNPSLVPVVSPRSDHHRAARILVRLQGIPIGEVRFSLETGTENVLNHALSAALDELAGPICDQLGIEACDPPRLRGELVLRSGRLPEAAHLPPVTVVICTRNRSDQLERSLARVERLEYPEFEVIIVDNDPDDDSTLTVFQRSVGTDPRFSYVREPLRGLSRARNRGLAEAKHAVVAYTDDDTLVDPYWLQGIALGFSRSAEVACVTGFIASAELETSSQHYFDRHSGWPTRVHPRLFDLSPASRTVASYPFSAGIFGAGANFAVQREFTQVIGGFDPALGAGSRVGGGEDLDLFLRVIFGDHKIAYEPSALIWHVHRDTDLGLERQLYQWGRGLAGYLTKTAIERATRRRFFARIPGSIVRIARVWLDRATQGEPGSTNVRFALIQTSGMVTGVVSYLWSRLDLQRSPPRS
jgi:glycosyltransferase involved in cell wall biosynthesis